MATVLHHPRLRTGLLLALAALLTVVGLITTPALAQSPAARAQKHLVAGEKAARAKKWDEALAAFQKAHEAQPSGATAIRVANALYQLDRLLEAQKAYEALLKDYDKTLFQTDKTKATERLEELQGKLGSLTIRVSEKDATVLVDDEPAGTSPLPGAVPLKAGGHRLVVRKEGFETYDKTVQVAAGDSTSVEVLLVELTSVGQVKVTEAEGRDIQVVIDGDEVGPAPYEGTLAPGDHAIAGTSDELAAPAQKVTITADETTTVVLEAGPRSGKLEVRLTDEVGTIFVDGKEVGTGSFEGELPVGEHTLKVTREGYEPFEKTVTVVATDVQVETVSLKKAATGDAQAEEEEGDWTFDGVYGGLQLGAMFLPAGTGSTLDAACDTLGATSCDTGTPVQVNIGGLVGYAFAPLGFELLVVGGAEMVEPSAYFDGTTGSDINPLVAAPERDEAFIIGRFGGGGALRARVLIPVDRFRFGGALGAGLAYRKLIMGRTVTAVDGTEAETSDDGQGYLTPVLSAELSAQVRFAGTTSFVLGLNLWLEHAGSDVTTEPEPDTLLTGDDDQIPHPLATPAYDLASGTQLYLGPFLGLQFGP